MGRVGHQSLGTPIRIIRPLPSRLVWWSEASLTSLGRDGDGPCSFGYSGACPPSSEVPATVHGSLLPYCQSIMPEVFGSEPENVPNQLDTTDES